MMYSISGIGFAPVAPSFYKCSSPFHGYRRNTTSLSPALKEFLSRKIFGGKSSLHSGATSRKVTESERVLVPGTNGEGTSITTDQQETSLSFTEEFTVIDDENDVSVEAGDMIKSREIQDSTSPSMLSTGDAPEVEEWSMCQQ